VYDLQTKTGWLLAGGILASNCRCSLDYQLVPTDEAVYSWGGYDDSEGEAEMAARATLRKYSEDQARDDHGKWTADDDASAAKAARERRSGHSPERYGWASGDITVRHSQPDLSKFSTPDLLKIRAILQRA
jgi:hypothetical protein